MPFAIYVVVLLASRVNSIDGAEMVQIPTGEFLMGSTEKEIDTMWKGLSWNDSWKQHARNEQPAHRVKLDAFWIYRHCVTVAQYRKFCNATRRAMPPAPSWGWQEDHPVVNVSWHDAKAYCAWANARLPYEAEWEYSARGGKRTTFSWGDRVPQLEKVANVADQQFKKSRYYNSNFRLFGTYDDGYTYTSPVGNFPANSYGLSDMTGNVWQWCEDWMGDYPPQPSSNPRGPATGTRKVLRGGAFDTPPEMTRIARRVSNLPAVVHDEKGFRCVQQR